MIKTPTCFKSKGKPILIDHIFINKKHSFIESQTIDTGRPPKKITYRDYRNIDENSFLNVFLRSIQELALQFFPNFFHINKSVLERHAPSKMNFFRVNNKVHININLRKGIMHRSKLRTT